MKVLVYSYREFDEKKWFDLYSHELDVQLKVCKEAPSMDNAYLAEGCKCISIVTTEIKEELVEEFYRLGVEFISTRTIGYDHVDVKRAKELGIKVGNAPYGPSSVADYAIMLMLMCTRKMKRIMERAAIQDFSLRGIQGRELPDFTIGVIGTGRIGRTVMEHLSGFGCKLLAYDIYETEEVKKYGEYVDIDTLLVSSDLITLHTPLTNDNVHLINKESIAKMKDNVIIINTARGALIDSEALISALESGKIGAAGLDVIEKEFELYYYDLKSEALGNRELSILRGFPNVIVTPHMAFYTDNAISSMVRHSLTSCKLYSDGKENPWQVI